MPTFGFSLGHRSLKETNLKKKKKKYIFICDVEYSYIKLDNSWWHKMFVPMKHLPDSNFWIQEVLHVILNENKIGFIFVFIEILAKFVEKLKNWCWYILEAPFSAAQPWVWPHLYRLHTREFGFFLVLLADPMKLCQIAWKTTVIFTAPRSRGW